MTSTILFITKDGTAYQAKGSIEYHREGEIYDNLKTWNSEKHPGHEEAVLKKDDRKFCKPTS